MSILSGSERLRSLGCVRVSHVPGASARRGDETVSRSGVFHVVHSIVWMAFSCIVAATPLEAQITINEILASNRFTNVDESGDAEDWIEFYNAGTQTVDLEGYLLTDYFTEPRGSRQVGVPLLDDPAPRSPRRLGVREGRLRSSVGRDRER